MPYGRPLRNQSMLILNEEMEHCDVWVTGSIYIGGAGVASGYYLNPERTAYQFVSDPSSGEMLFRTGDLGRVRPDGLLEILGREDSQVKVNGFRIELGEIERVLTSHDEVHAAAVAVHGSALCAYLVPTSASRALLQSSQGGEDEKGGRSVSKGGSEAKKLALLYESVRKMCMDTIAEYMVPQHYTLIEAIPLSANGKVQREKLPSPGTDDSESSRTPHPSRGAKPASLLEEKILMLFVEVLSLPENDISTICCKNDTFFHLGGNSISAIKLIFACKQLATSDAGKDGSYGSLEVESLTVQRFFSFPTVQGVAMSLSAGTSSHEGEGSSVAKRAVAACSALGSSMHVICLQEGALEVSKEKVPMLLFNPAGASAITYTDFARYMDSERAVLAIDDGFVMGMGEFSFQSIEAVASSCLSLVELITHKDYFGEKIVLAGWSYGGVLAAEVATQLSAMGSPIDIVALILHDSPLRRSVHFDDHDNHILSERKRRLQGEVSGEQESQVDLRAAEHYADCTRLLGKYHQRSTLQPTLSIPLLDVRPVLSTSAENVNQGRVTLPCPWKRSQKAL